MITVSQYEDLLRYREGQIPVSQTGLSPIDMELLEMRLIEPAEFMSSTYGFVKSIATPLSYQITEKGRAALDEYETHQQEKKAQKRKQFWRDLTIAICGGAVGAVIGSVMTLLIEHLIL